MKYNIKLDSFEGPFDLLFHLIEKNQIDIYNIPIAEITDQYMEYIRDIDYLDMETASEFLLMAATLLEIKSKMLLPNPIEEQMELEAEGIDPRRDLVIKLLEYKKYKKIATFLMEREEAYSKIFFREQTDMEEFCGKDLHNNFDFKMDKAILIEAIKRVIRKIDRLDENRQNYFRELKREIYTVENKIELLKKMGEEKKELKFSELFSNCTSKIEVIVTFLALLELLKMKCISVFQNKQFGDIHINFI